jgi:magnesium-transporting ATPase (P-type)
MTVRHVVVGDRVLDYSKADSGSSTSVRDELAFYVLLRSGVLCNSITGELDLDPEAVIRRPTNPVDKALVVFASKFKDLHSIRVCYPTKAVVPFNSRNKWMATIHTFSEEMSPTSTTTTTEASTSEDLDLLLMKGAPEYMLQRCTTYLEADGTEVPLTSEAKNEFAQVTHEYYLCSFMYVTHHSEQHDYSRIYECSMCCASVCSRLPGVLLWQL